MFRYIIKIGVNIVLRLKKKVKKFPTYFRDVLIYKFKYFYKSQILLEMCINIKIYILLYTISSIFLKGALIRIEKKI